MPELGKGQVQLGNMVFLIWSSMRFLCWVLQKALIIQMHEIHEYFEISPSVLQRQFYDSVVSVRIQGVVAPPSRRERDRSLAITFEYRFRFDAKEGRSYITIVLLCCIQGLPFGSSQKVPTFSFFIASRYTFMIQNPKCVGTHIAKEELFEERSKMMCITYL